MTESNIEFRYREFREMVEQKFNDELHKAGGQWSDCPEAMDAHWEDLMGILDREIHDRAHDWVEQQEQSNEPHPSLTAAERNPNLR